MVAHQHIGVQPATEPPQCLPQALQVALAVKVIQKTRQPVVAPLHHVLGNTGKIKTRLASHAHSIAALPARSCQPKPCPRIIPIPPPSGIVTDTFFPTTIEIVPDTFTEQSMKKGMPSFQASSAGYTEVETATSKLADFIHAITSSMGIDVMV